MTSSRNVGPRLLVTSTAIVLAVQIACATPARAQASPDCFKVCSAIFYKHVGTVVKCAYKGVTDAAALEQCATKAATKMHDKYVVKLQKKCGGVACVTAYPETRDVGCEALLFSTASSAQVVFGNLAVPNDMFTQDLIIDAGLLGCLY